MPKKLSALLIVFLSAGPCLGQESSETQDSKTRERIRRLMEAGGIEQRLYANWAVETRANRHAILQKLKGQFAGLPPEKLEAIEVWDRRRTNSDVLGGPTVVAKTSPGAAFAYDQRRNLASTGGLIPRMLPCDSPT